MEQAKRQETGGDHGSGADLTSVTRPLSTRIPARGLFEDDWRARPTTERPYPVVLVHGTTTTKGDWMELGRQLRAAGWAVFAPDFGNRATAPLEESADQLAAYFDVVLKATGAKKLILVGHSQGGILCRMWLEQAPGARHKVKHLVMLATPNHGTEMGGIINPLIRSPRASSFVDSVVRNWFGPAGFDQITGTKILDQLNADTTPLPGVSYTCIATRSDTLIYPPDSCFLFRNELPEKPDAIRNLWVQDFHPRAIVLHEDMPYDRRVRDIVVADIERFTR